MNKEATKLAKKSHKKQEQIDEQYGTVDGPQAPLGPLNVDDPKIVYKDRCHPRLIVEDGKLVFKNLDSGRHESPWIDISTGEVWGYVRGNATFSSGMRGWVFEWRDETTIVMRHLYGPHDKTCVVDLRPTEDAETFRKSNRNGLEWDFKNVRSMEQLAQQALRRAWNVDREMTAAKNRTTLFEDGHPSDVHKTSYEVEFVEYDDEKRAVVRNRHGDYSGRHLFVRFDGTITTDRARNRDRYERSLCKAGDVIDLHEIDEWPPMEEDR